MQARYPQGRLTDQLVLDFNEGFSAYSSDSLKVMSFGYSRAASSILWLRFLLQTPPRSIEASQVSWIYLDLKAVTELDPEFYPAYEMGGIFLSVITQDKKGAEQILLRGTQAFPDRWRIFAYLGYHYQYEIVNPEGAAKAFKAAAALPGVPPMVKVLATSYTSKFEGEDAGLTLIQDMLNQAKDPLTRNRLEEKIRRMKKSKQEKDRG